MAETWLIQPPTFLPDWISNYNIKCSNATREFSIGRPRGGLCVFTKKDCIISSFIFQNERCLFMLLTMGMQRLIIGLIYFSPSLEDDEWCVTLKLAFVQIEKLNLECPIIVGGDFNGRVGDLNQVDETVMEYCVR